MNEEFVEAEFWSIVNEEYGDTQVVSFEQAYEIINPYPGVYVVIMEEHGEEKRQRWIQTTQ